MPARTPEQVRSSVEATRQDLTYSLNDLQSKVTALSDWRRPLRENKNAVIAGAAVAGFVLGGGIAATLSLLRRRR